MYRIEFNTGDEYWDNPPDVVECETLDEVKEQLSFVAMGQNELSEENIKELEQNGELFDESEEVWRIYEI